MHLAFGVLRPDSDVPTPWLSGANLRNRMTNEVDASKAGTLAVNMETRQQDRSFDSSGVPEQQRQVRGPTPSGAMDTASKTARV